MLTGKDKSWMGQSEQLIQQVCLEELKQIRDWEKHPVEFKPYYVTLLPEILDKHLVWRWLLLTSSFDC